jgi:hypothetical protein
MRLRKDIPDEQLLSAGVYALDPMKGILASQAALILGRSKTRMDSDRRDSKPPLPYKDGSKVLYPLGAVLSERARLQGKTLEEAAKEAADAIRGWPTFTGFLSKGATMATWPIASVGGYPVDFFATLEMDPQDEDFGDIEDLTAAEFKARRLSFYRDKPSGWGTAPTPIGKAWASALQMATSRTEGWERGYQQAIEELYTGASDGTNREQAAKRTARRELEDSGNYAGVRQALDTAPDDLPMSRHTAQFYLGMSPGSFTKALARNPPPHPFAGTRGGATKGEVDRWFRELVAGKHAKAMPEVRVRRVARDLTSGRPYLVDDTGVILADGEVTYIHPLDTAYIASLGAGLRILSLGTALGMPWRSQIERQAWAGFRERRLERRASEADHALTKARVEDQAAGGGASLP